MPRGVTDQFLKILHHERRRSVRTVVLMAFLVPFAYFMAELADKPLFGWAVLATLVALALGVGVGIWWSHLQTKQYNASLKEKWNAWMRMSLSATSVNEVARHADGKEAARSVAGAAWGGLVVANGVLFAALWFDASWASAFGIMIAVANGLVVGALAAHAAGTFRWVSYFHKALDELVAEGQLGMWGEV